MAALQQDLAAGIVPGDAASAVRLLQLLFDPSDLVLPASGYAETMVRAHRAGSSGPVRAKLDGLGIAISPLSEEMAEEAAHGAPEFHPLRLDRRPHVARGALHAITCTTDKRSRRFWRRLIGITGSAEISRRQFGSRRRCFRRRRWI